MSPLHEECVWINGPDPRETTPLRLVLPARAVSWSYYLNRLVEIEFSILNVKDPFRVILPEDFRFTLTHFYDKKFKLTLEEVV